MARTPEAESKDATGIMYKLAKKELALRSSKRGRYDAGLRWYAIMTHCGRECSVANAIEREIRMGGEDEALLPVYRRPDQAEREDEALLFSSYLFLRTRMNDEIYMAILALEGVFKVLGEAWRVPTVIEDREIELLKLVLRAHERPELVARTREGDEVEIASGLMKGARGRVTGGNARYVKLQLRFSFFEPESCVQVMVPRSSIKLRLDERELKSLTKRND